MKSFESRPTLGVKTCLAFLQVLSLIPLSLSHKNIITTIFISTTFVIWYILQWRRNCRQWACLSLTFYVAINNIVCGGCWPGLTILSSKNSKICKLFHLEVFDFSQPDQKRLSLPLGGWGFQNCQPKNDECVQRKLGDFPSHSHWCRIKEIYLRKWENLDPHQN